LLHPGPLAFLRQFLLGLVASGSEVEDLRIARIDAQSAAARRLLLADVIQIRVEPDVAMHEALQLLKGHGVRPDEPDRATIGAERALRQIAGFGRPLRM